MKTYKELKDKNEGYQEDQNLAVLVGCLLYTSDAADE